jgi:methylenetetrahydrofolate--tRNA-(uracil-5-)-methyltransferase
MAVVTVVGGGLAGSEAAWQIAQRGVDVCLYEMRPGRETGAHRTADLAELVCSNSLGSMLPDRASGILLAELRRMGSLLVECAQAAALPAGGALAVDREDFARRVTGRITAHPRIHMVREEVKSLPKGIVVVASGPLTSDALAEELARLTGEDHLYFFDALSPIVEADSLDRAVIFPASRYGIGREAEGDYLNAPLTQEEYEAFVAALVSAERIRLRGFEEAIPQGVLAGAERHFEACLPAEVIASRGALALAYGPMRPVGLADPRSGRRPYAVLQLRQDNLARTLYNLVGFQTNLTFAEQRRVFRMIPGMAQARFARYGQMHRNTFLISPKLLQASLQHRQLPDLLFAGQITGVEGYLGNIGTGLLAGVNASRVATGKPAIALPPTTMLGALCRYITEANPATFQPMKANLGLLPPLPAPVPRQRRVRAVEQARRAAADLERAWIEAWAPCA